MRAIPQKSLEDLEWRPLLERLAERCQTERGASRAREVRPLTNPDTARERLGLVQQARRLRALEIRISLQGVAPLDALLDRVDRRGVLEGEELLQVAGTLAACGHLRRLGRAQADEVPELAALLERLEPLADVREAIEECFDDHGRLADHASEALASLRQRVRSLRDEAIGRLKQMLADPAMERLLQDDYYTDRDDRYVLPIKAELRHEVAGIVQGSSASGATVFMEPEAIVDLNNRIKLAALELEREQRQILNDLTLLVREERQRIRRDLERLSLLDQVVAAARLADDLGCGPVRVDEAGRLVLRGLRHPLMVLSGTEVVPNDVELLPGAALVITGPNTGGKTVLLKTVGLCALMLRAGLVPSCTGESAVPIYDSVLSDMGDDQSIEASLSSFSAHMTNIGRLLDQAGAGDLVLLDEVAVGTDPIQGAALGRAILEAFADRESQVLVTTHYAQLKELPARDPRFVNASLGFDLERIRPTYRLARGAPGSSSALAVARQLGLPAELLERAAGLLDPAAAKLDHLLESLDRERATLAEQREDLESAQKEVARSRAQLEARLQELERERRALHEKHYDGAVAALRGARDELERIRRQLKRAPKEAQVQRMARQINEQSASIADQAPAPDGPPSRPAEEADLQPGARVWAQSLGREATVVERTGPGHVQVQAGPLKVRIPVQEARVVTGPGVPGGAGGAAANRGKKGSKKARAGAPGAPGAAPSVVQAARDQVRGAADRTSGAYAGDSSPGEPGPRTDVDEADHVHLREPQTTCDLRGLRVEEAEEALARFLDRMVLDGVRSVLVIHGHGTGALRRQVREQLRRSPAIRHQRPGGPREGGDGVTVAFL